MAFALLATGCVSGSYDRVSEGEPIDEWEIAALDPERSSLGECLQILGAPTIVQPLDDETVVLNERARISMAWIWLDRSGFSIRVSAPLFNLRSNREIFRYRNDASSYRAVVALFDDDLGLVSIRRGFLTDFDEVDVSRALRRR